MDEKACNSPETRPHYCDEQSGEGNEQVSLAPVKCEGQAENASMGPIDPSTVVHGVDRIRSGLGVGVHFGGCGRKTGYCRGDEALGYRSVANRFCFGDMAVLSPLVYMRGAMVEPRLLTSAKMKIDQ